jgi:hypothetical protein
LGHAQGCLKSWHRSRSREGAVLAQVAVQFPACSNRRAGYMTCGPGPPCWTRRSRKAAGSCRVPGSPARAASALLSVPPLTEAAGRGFFADEIVGASRGLTSGSTALVACPRPSSGVVGEGLVAAASALRSSLLLFGRPERRSLSLLPERASASHLGLCRPAGPPMWGVVRTCGGGTGVPFVMAP